MSKRKEKMLTIDEILVKMEDNQRKTLEEVMKRGLVAMGREKVAWKSFQVYSSSVNKMEIILKDPSFMFAIVASLNEFNTCVNIAVMRCQESGVYSRKINEMETLSIVYIAEREYKRLIK